MVRVIHEKHLHDATEIFRTLGQHKRECFIKLGFHILCFFYYLYRYTLRIFFFFLSLLVWLTNWCDALICDRMIFGLLD